MSDKDFKVKNGLVVNGTLLVANTSTSRIGILTSTPAVTLDLGVATDGIMLPVGTTGQRPTGANGMIRFNSTLGAVEEFVNNAWGAIGGNSLVVPGGTGGNTQLIFNDSNTLGASAGFTFDKTTNNAVVANTITVGTGATTLTITGSGIASGNVQFSRVALTIGANVTIDTTGYVIGNTHVNSGTITLGSGATINTTSYTGAAASAGSATSAGNSTNLNGQAASFYLDCGNFTGTLAAARLGTNQTPQFDSLGVGLAAPGSKALSVFGNITSQASISAAGNIISNTSDRRFKIHVTSLVDAVNKVRKLNGIRYQFNDLAHSMGYRQTDWQVGLFADEVEQVLPESVVLTPADQDVDGSSISGENYKAVMYERIVPLLVEAIKELTDRIERLESR